MSGSDKTEAPTPKRKRDARRKGQIARSPELVTWAQVLAATSLLRISMGMAATRFPALMTAMGNTIREAEIGQAESLLGRASIDGLLTLAPLALGLMLVALLGNFAQTGLLVSGHKLKPTAEHINPLKGLKRMFSPRSAFELGKTLIRTLVLGLVAWSTMKRVATEFSAQQMTIVPMASKVAITSLDLIKNIALVGLMLAVADYVFARRKIMKTLRMTKQEVKDEYKATEGDPHIRSQRRARQMELSRNRMMSDVRHADAVVVNPTHVAVAIRYHRGKGAPRVIAKGTDGLAARIRAEAEKHGVPIVQDIPLARTLYGACDLGQEIPAELFEAVARLLAFVMSVGRRATWAGPLTMRGTSPIPESLQDLAADADVRRAARKAALHRAQGRRPLSEAQ